VQRVAFSRDGSTLHTDIGRLNLGNAGATHQLPDTGAQSTIMLESSWIKSNGVDLLWLPHEYRGICHDVFGSYLVIGHVSGAVSFLAFK
jgi:hypothetical protein